MLSLARAIRTAADLGAKVINVSLASCTNAAAPVNQDPLGAAVCYAAVDKDAMIMAAAGNKNDRCNPTAARIRRSIRSTARPGRSDTRATATGPGPHHRQPGMVLRLRAVGGRRDPRRAARCPTRSTARGSGSRPRVRASWAYPV